MDLSRPQEMSASRGPAAVEPAITSVQPTGPKPALLRDDVLPDIVFREGDLELREFPTRLREQLTQHVRLCSKSLLWGVACKEMNKPLFMINGSPCHYRLEDGQKLLAARYQYGSAHEITVVMESVGNSLDDGHAVLVTDGKTCAATTIGQVKYKRTSYRVWRPNHDVRESRDALRVYRCTELGGDQQATRNVRTDKKRPGSDDSDSGVSRPSRNATVKLPLHFERVEGSLSAVFPTYLVDDITQSVRTKSVWPSCARIKRTDRSLFSYHGKRVEYRHSSTQEILLAGRYTCQNRYFDIVRGSGFNKTFDDKSVLIGDADGARGDVPQDDGSIACVTYYYVWSNKGSSTRPEIEKWIFQKPSGTQKNRDLNRFPVKRASQSNTVLSNEPSVLGLADDAVGEFEYTGDSDSEISVLIQRPRSPIHRGKHQLDLSASNSSAASKRQRSNHYEVPNARPDEDTPPLQQRFLTRPRDNGQQATFAHQHGEPQLLQQIEHKPSIGIPTEAANPPELISEPDHYFVFKANVVDEDVYPPKSVKNCDEVSLLFRHAIQSGIANKNTASLLLQGRTQKWNVVRRDQDQFEEVLKFLRQSEISQRVVVMPDEDW